MYVRVQVKPGARKEAVIQTDDKTFSIAVKEPAEQNLANTRVKQILAEEFDVSIKKIRLTSGHRSPRKIYEIEV